MKQTFLRGLNLAPSCHFQSNRRPWTAFRVAAALGTEQSTETLLIASWASGFTRERRVFSRKQSRYPFLHEALLPARHTQVFDLPLRRMLSTVPSPPVGKSTISAGLQAAAIGGFEGDG